MGVAVGPDYDPGKESDLLYDSAGNPITQEYLDNVAAEFEALDDIPDNAQVQVRVGGRPSLSEPGQHSPSVHFRLPENLRVEAERRAREEGTTVSKLARAALERYLAEDRKAG